MFSKPESLTSREVDLLNREELIDMLLENRDLVRTTFTSEWLARQSTERLRVLLLAVQLYRALRYPAHGQEGGGPPT
jgi:hypothetical protein